MHRSTYCTCLLANEHLTALVTEKPLQVVAGSCRLAMVCRHSNPMHWRAGSWIIHRQVLYGETLVVYLDHSRRSLFWVRLQSIGPLLLPYFCQVIPFRLSDVIPYSSEGYVFALPLLGWFRMFLRDENGSW
jgi:hypothetical protein